MKFSALHDEIIEHVFTSAQGATVKELAAKIGRSTKTIGPRMPELVQMRAVKNTGLYVRINGKKEIVWMPVI